jgi:hypothetical protein
MNGIKCLIGVALLIGMLGCENRTEVSRQAEHDDHAAVAIPEEVATVQSTETLDGFTASMFTDGSLALELRNDDQLIAKRVVSDDIVYPGNAVVGVARDKGGLDPWCIAHCHVDPSTTKYVAWNTETDEVITSPGYTFGMIRSGDGEDVLVTINRAHFDRSPDPAATIYVNGVALVNVGDSGWKVTGYTNNSVTLTGTTFLDESITTRMTFAGQWVSDSDQTYDVYHVYSEFQTMTEHWNVRGNARVYFVREGEVVAETSTAGMITVQDGELFVEDRGTVRRWDPEGRFTDDL